MQHDALTAAGALAAVAVVARLGEPVGALSLVAEGAGLGSLVGGAIGLWRKHQDPHYDLGTLVMRWMIASAVVWTAGVTLVRGVA